jgi:hypothetical protein
MSGVPSFCSWYGLRNGLKTDMFFQNRCNIANRYYCLRPSRAQRPTAWRLTFENSVIVGRTNVNGCCQYFKLTLSIS